MALIKYETKEISLKIVLAGPEGSGKLQVAQFIYDSVPEWNKQKPHWFYGGLEPVLLFNFRLPNQYRHPHPLREAGL